MKHKDSADGFRHLPVRGTGKKNYRSNVWRIAKTPREQRHCYDDPDLLLAKRLIRAKRSFNRLYSVWDDYVRSDASARNWKHYRKTQWK